MTPAVLSPAHSTSPAFSTVPAHSTAGALDGQTDRPLAPRRSLRRETLRHLAAAVGVLALAACGPTTPTPSGTGSPEDTTSAPASTAPGPSANSSGTDASATSPLVVEEAWAVARPRLEPMPMTAVFATLRNPTAHEVAITAATTTASDRAELHTTVTPRATGHATMQPVPHLTVPAGGELILRPGGDHIMVMAMTRPLPAGTRVRVTLTLEGASSLTFEAVAKPFTGAQEPYHATDGSTGSSTTTQTQEVDESHESHETSQGHS